MNMTGSTRGSAFVPSRFVSWCLGVLVVCIWCSPFSSAAPLLKSIRPLGAQRGTTFTLILVGQELTPGSELITTLPATITRLAPPKDLKIAETELPFLVELRSDCPIAAYPLRLKSTDGISNVLLFSVSDFPEIQTERKGLDEEKAGNRDRGKAVLKITPPVVVNGNLKEADQDTFSFIAKAGQTLVFEVEARRLGSAIDPVIRVLDSAGREIAFNDDAPMLGVDSRVQVKFPRDGDYRIVVHDSRFSDQAQNFYRLKIGNYYYCEGIFPLGWQRGRAVEATLFGGNLPKPVIVHPSLRLPVSQRVAMIGIPPMNGVVGSLPVPFIVGDQPEMLEPVSNGPVDLPGEIILNGRISKPGEKDLYRLAVRPGEKWLLEVHAASLGTTRMGAYLEIHDGKMKLLSSAIDASSLVVETEFSFAPREKGVDPKIVFQVPDNVEELILSVEDVNKRGGPDYGYRLRTTRKFEDFALEYSAPYLNIPAGGTAAVAVRVIRDSYHGPIRIGVVNARDDLIVEGGHIPARVTEGLLVVTSKSGLRVPMVDFEVWGEGTSANNEPIRRRVMGPGLITAVKGARRQVGGVEVATQKPYRAWWLGMDLPAGLSGPAPFAFEVAEREIKVVQGLKHQIGLKLARNAPITTPIRIEGIRPGGIDISIRGGSLDPKSDSLSVQVSANPNAKVGRFDMVLVGRADIGGREVSATSPCIIVDLVRAFSLVIPEETIQIGSGSTVALHGKVHRQYPFQGAVSLKVEDLPLHISCGPVEVLYNESEFALNFQADPGVEPGVYGIRLVATAKMEGRKDDKDYSIPDTKLRLKIIGGMTGDATEKSRAK